MRPTSTADSSVSRQSNPHKHSVLSDSFHRWVPYLLLLVGIVRLVNLGYLDMQAFDEGLYAMRALAVARFDLWVDQSSLAIGGLYSATHPPLYVWLAGISMKILGPTEFAMRLPSVLAGAALLPIVYAIGCRFRFGATLLTDDTPSDDAVAAARRTGLFAALLLAFNPFVDFYARQGQFDILLTFWLALSLWAFLRADNSTSWWYAVVAGLALGAALLTKLFIGGGLLLAFLLWLLATRRAGGRGGRFRLLAITAAVAAAVALPWHIYMTVVHGAGDPLFLLRQSQMLERFVSGIEGNQKSLEIFYFVNQLFVVFPLGILWGIGGLVRAARRRLGRSGMLMAITFALYFIVLSLVRTKLEFYTLPMLLPLSLLAAAEIARAFARRYPRPLLGVMIGGSALAVLWSAQQEWRTGLKDVLRNVATGRPESVLDIWLPIALALVALGIGIAVARYGLPTRALHLLPYLMFVPAAFYSLVTILVLDNHRWRDGGFDVAQRIQQRAPVVLRVAGYETNPQLTWYLHGADAGWTSDVRVVRSDPTGHADTLRAWLATEWGTIGGRRRDLYLVERDRLLRGELFTTPAVTPPGYRVLFESRRYTLLERVVAPLDSAANP